MIVALIEDEPDCFENYEVILHERGHDVRIFTEADEVIDNIQDILKCDVVILDLMIQLGTKIQPEEAPETGIAIYKRLRAASVELRILVLTARSQSEVWSFFAKDKRVHFCLKPISDLAEFHRLVEDWTDEK